DFSPAEDSVPTQLAEWVEENAGKPKPGWLLLYWFCPSATTTAKVGRHPSICHPDRSVPGFPVTQYSPTPACAAFSKESRMKLANATKLDRKSGAAEWRDLRCASPSSNSAAFKAFTLRSC